VTHKSDLDCLNLGRRDIEPLGDGRVDRSRGSPRVKRQAGVSGIIPPDETRRIGNSDILDGEVVGGGTVGCLASDQTAPGLVALVDNFSGVLLVLRLPREGKGILGLSIRNLIDPEPLVGGADQAREVPLDVLNVVELGSKRVCNVDHYDLPVGLAFIKESHDTKDFHLLDLTNVADLFANLANIKWIVITLGLGLSM